MNSRKWEQAPKLKPQRPKPPRPPPPRHPQKRTISSQTHSEDILAISVAERHRQALEGSPRAMLINRVTSDQLLIASRLSIPSYSLPHPHSMGLGELVRYGIFVRAVKLAILGEKRGEPSS